MDDKEEVMVSVIVITYNHGHFIGQAIESIVTQKVNFKFELVIGEDCSPDNTRQICEHYARQYPDIIKLLPSDRNYGPMANFLRILAVSNGKYIALCEGDDYWCDPLKLRKQVDFLESNPEFTTCFTSVGIEDEMGWELPDEHYFPKPQKDVFTIDDFILSEMNIIPTPTVLYKNVLPNPLPDFYIQALVGDMGLQLFAADKGKAKWLNQKTAVYRNHAGGVTKSKETIETANTNLMNFYREFNEYTGYKYNAVFRKRFLMNATMHLIFGARDKKGWERVKHYFRRMPAYLKYSDKLKIKEFLYYNYVLLFPSFIKKKK